MSDAPRQVAGETVLTRRGVRVELASAASFVVAMLASIGLAVVYWQGGQPQAEGALLALALGGIGVGIVLWAKHFMPNDEVVEEREPLESSEEDVAAFTADFAAGQSSLRSRRVLVATAGGACAALGVAVLFPIRSLGPRPGRGLKETPYRTAPIRVVTNEGEPLRPEDLPVDGFVTVWPEGHTDAADASTLLIHVRDSQDFQPAPGREDWTVDNIVAYSKLCTHVGCPVGLYQAELGLLLCPCHQSTFDVLEHARPIFGPAARSLPQLPLDTDEQGYIIATADFSGPVGPGFWDRDR
ncbi:MAG TPA: ubiquinol-cytochrome c reductase iron-sulfur subunit [Acidimicrobiales bacterium]|nr:ubiquinol-cytochrome c reductase iron-sulfur subunit [Acidimicrobiales bacterium]